MHCNAVPAFLSFGQPRGHAESAESRCRPPPGWPQHPARPAHPPVLALCRAAGAGHRHPVGRRPGVDRAAPGIVSRHRSRSSWPWCSRLRRLARVPAGPARGQRLPHGAGPGGSRGRHHDRPLRRSTAVGVSRAVRPGVAAYALLMPPTWGALTAICASALFLGDAFLTRARRAGYRVLGPGGRVQRGVRDRRGAGSPAARGRDGAGDPRHRTQAGAARGRRHPATSGPAC